MRTIGLIGGTSYVSTIDYYRLINEGVNKKLGQKNSARILLHSVNFEEEYDVIEERGWDAFLDRVEHYARNLHKIGAQGLMLCANTPHIIAPQLKKRLELPLIDITEETAKVIMKKGMKKVGLLGTKFTMQADFYKKMLEKHKSGCLVPAETDILKLHDIIFSELTKDIFTDESKQYIIDLMNDLKSRGAEGVIMGCTEIPLIVSEDDTDIPLFNTLKIHADAAVRFILEGHDQNLYASPAL